MKRERAERERISPHARLPRRQDEELDWLVVGFKALRGQLEGHRIRMEACEQEGGERLEEIYRLLAQQLLEARGVLGVDRGKPAPGKRYRPA